MNETLKCYQFRKERGDFNNFLYGRGIDIGGGSDVLVVESGSVVCWDKKDGDAQELAGIQNSLFDFVYSSHCLEHLDDIRKTLENWTRVLKPNGIMYIVVPDYLYYEKMTWPSMYNSEHKHSFSADIARHKVGRSNHWHIFDDLLPELYARNLSICWHSLELHNFDYNNGTKDQTLGAAVAQHCLVARKSKL